MVTVTSTSTSTSTSDPAAPPGIRAPWQWLTGAALIFLGVMVMVGWFTYTPPLVGFMGAFPSMVLNTAALFMVCGLVLVLSQNSRLLQLPCVGLAVFVGSLALATLAEHVFGWDLGIDHAQFHAWLQDGFPHPGRMAVSTAVCFVLAAFCMLVLLLGHRFVRGARGVAIAIVSIGVIAGLGKPCTSH